MCCLLSAVPAARGTGTAWAGLFIDPQNQQSWGLHCIYSGVRHQVQQKTLPSEGPGWWDPGCVLGRARSHQVAVSLKGLKAHGSLQNVNPLDLGKTYFLSFPSINCKSVAWYLQAAVPKHCKLFSNDIFNSVWVPWMKFLKKSYINAFFCNLNCIQYNIIETILANISLQERLFFPFLLLLAVAVTRMTAQNTTESY